MSIEIQKPLTIETPAVPTKLRIQGRSRASIDIGELNDADANALTKDWTRRFLIAVTDRRKVLAEEAAEAERQAAEADQAPEDGSGAADPDPDIIIE